MIRSIFLSALTLLLTAPLAMSQLASSTNYQLLADEFAGGGDGTCSLSFAMMFASEPMSGAQVASISFNASPGFLTANDPKPTNAPVIFGITPDCGPTMGGVGVTITGLNFQKLGAGPTITATIGGAAVSSLVVASDTTITGLTPAGTAGPKNVVVSSIHGSGTLTNGYEYSAGLIPYGTGTPGCLGSQLMSASSCPNIGNATFQITCTNVPPLALGLCLATDSPDVAGSFLFGLGLLFHVDFAFATPTEIYGLDMISDASNFGTVTAPISNVPALIGKNYYAQSFWVEIACFMGTVGNLSASRGLQIVIEP